MEKRSFCDVIEYCVLHQADTKGKLWKYNVKENYSAIRSCVR